MAKMSPIIPMLLVSLGIISIIGGTVYYIQEHEKLDLNQRQNLATLPFGIDSFYGQGESTFPTPTSIDIPSDGVYLNMIYFFNITNHVQYLNGTDPIFQKVGPYSYDTIGGTVNKRWFEKGNIYCSAGFTTYNRFLPEWSVGSESDIINVHDAVYHPLMAQWTEAIVMGGAAADLVIKTFLGIVNTPGFVESIYPFKAPEYLPIAIEEIVQDIATSQNVSEGEAYNYTLNAFVNATGSVAGIPSWFRVSGDTPSGISIEAARLMFDSTYICSFTHYFVLAYVEAGFLGDDRAIDYIVDTCPELNITEDQAVSLYTWYAHTYNAIQLRADLEWDYNIIDISFLYLHQFRDQSVLYFSMQAFYPDKFVGEPELRKFGETPGTTPDFDGFELYYILTQGFPNRDVARPFLVEYFANPTEVVFSNVYDQPGVPAFNHSVQNEHTSWFIWNYLYDPVRGQTEVNVKPVAWVAGDPYVAVHTSVRNQTTHFSTPWYDAFYKGLGGAGLIDFPSEISSISEAESVLQPYCIYTGKDDWEQFGKPVINNFQWNGVEEPITGRTKSNLGAKYLYENKGSIRIWDNLMARSYLWNREEKFEQKDLPFIKYVPDWEGDTLAYNTENAKYGNVAPGVYNLDGAGTDFFRMFRTQVNFVGCAAEQTTDHIQGMTQEITEKDFEMFYTYEEYSGIAVETNYVWQINLLNSKALYYNYFLDRKMTTDVLKPCWIIRDSYSAVNRQTRVINPDVELLFNFNGWDIIRKSRNIMITLVVIGSVMVIAGVVMAIIMLVRK